MAIHKRRRGLLLVEIESPEGTAATFDAADDNHLVYDVSVTPDIQKFFRKPFSPTLGTLPPVIGTRASRVSFKVELKGQGGLGVLLRPEFDKILRSGGFQVEDTKVIGIGAVTSGPFLDGETVSSPSGSGVLHKNRATGVGELVYVVAAGVIATAELITGATSGATATSSSGATDYGTLYRPDSGGGESATIGVYFNYGTSGSNTNSAVVLAGARCEIVFVADETGAPVFLEVTYTGRLHSAGEVSFTPSVVGDAKQPMPFLGTQTTLPKTGGATWTPCFSSFRFDMGSVLGIRKCSNNAAGIESVIISDYDPKFVIDPELVEAAVFEAFSEITAGTIGEAEWFTLGSTAGRIVNLYSPQVGYENFDLSGEREGIQLVGLDGGAYIDPTSPSQDRFVQLMVR